MNIGIDVRYQYSHSGIGRYLRNIIDNIQHSDIKNKYILFDKKIESSLLWEQIILPFNAILSKIDLMFYPNWRMPLFFNKPYIMTIHDIIPIRCNNILTNTKLNRYHKIYLNYMKRAIYNAEKIIAVSEYTKNDTIDYFKINPDKIKVIYHGIDKRFYIKPELVNINLVKLKYSIDKPFIMYVGRFDKYKNIDFLITTFSNLKHNISHNCYIIGNGTEEQINHLNNVINHLSLSGKVKIITDVSDDELVIFYNIATALVIPSLYEGFGFPVIEAMACGCPVITSNRTSLPEIVKDAGLMFNPDNEEELTSLLDRVLIDETTRNSLIKNGLQRSQYFTWENSIIEHVKVFNEVLDEIK